MIEIKSRPILFSAPMVDAILNGYKTQTRRAMKPQPPEWCKKFGFTCFTPRGSVSGRGTFGEDGPAEKFFKCPYGAPGDRLWVRETFSLESAPGEVLYRATTCKDSAQNYKWKPSIFMPRVLSRIELEIVSLRVERLNDISEGDAIAEGIDQKHLTNDVSWCANLVNKSMACDRYARIWEEINGRNSWDLNPYVWRIEFRRIEKEPK